MKDQDRLTEKNESVKENEIDLMALVKTLWEGRRTVIKSVMIFAFLGLFIALFSKKEFTASTTMVPQNENSSSKLGGMASLASLAGFNLDMNAGSDAISPMLYPQIISSVNFQLEIMNTEYLFEEIEKPISLLDYYLDVYKPGLFGTLKKYSFGLPGIIISAIKGEESSNESFRYSKALKLSKDQDEIRKVIEENLSLEVNDKEGYLTLISRFHQAYLSAQIALKSQQLLQEYVTKFKVEKATAQLEFIKERYKEKKVEFEGAQSNLAAFQDANRNISSAFMRTQEERLQNENQLAFEVYSELAKQLEQSLIKVKEDTPVFSVIEEVTIPIEKTKPNRLTIIIIWVVFGGILGIVIVFGKSFISDFKKSWNNTLIIKD